MFFLLEKIFYTIRCMKPSNLVESWNQKVYNKYNVKEVIYR